MQVIISCSRGGLKKRIKNAWYKKDFNLWIDLLLKAGMLHNDDINNRTTEYQNARMMWHFRKDINNEPGFTFGYDIGVASGDVCV